uniref:Bromo domain-containing protein n=1 Tax=Rhabditophanes sp. KR3021 TaxID=114890 RepID=A0AC35UB86_9BILA
MEVRFKQRFLDMLGSIQMMKLILVKVSGHKWISSLKWKTMFLRRWKMVKDVCNAMNFQGSQSLILHTRMTLPRQLVAKIATNSQDWGEKEMDVVLNRAKGAIMMMRSDEVEIFNDPVDFNLYPDYLDVVPYPIDLSLIVKRIEHKFYRRLVALEQGIKQIAINSELYNGILMLLRLLKLWLKLYSFTSVLMK